MIKHLRNSKKVCLDSCSIIYFIEDHPQYANLLEPVFKAIGLGSLLGVSSFISLIEVLIKPLQERKHDLAEQYRDILTRNRYFQLQKVDQEIAQKAAEIRANFKLKVPDSIQLATAELCQSDLFITNDSKLKTYKNINVIVLKDYLS